MDLTQYAQHKENQLTRVSKIRDTKKYKGFTHDFRTHADIDYSRILYSSAYRRLQGKMQLFIPKSEVFYRNRLTHSHEVAQIAKTIAKKLKLSDTLTVQTCSLAHDIGNPPFGHAGENFLNEIYPEYPFEGNAQTLRILRQIEERHFEFNGLNLTIRTLLGVVKYYAPESSTLFLPLNVKKTIPNKKFLYKGDYETVTKWITEFGIEHKTIDCEIMDIADEIAYAVHDLEDSLKLKYFTIDELLHEFNISDDFKEITKEFETFINKAKKFANKAIVYETSEEYAMLFRKELTSLLSSAFIIDLGLVNNKLSFLSLGKLVKGLKVLTFKSIKRRPDIIEYEQLGKHVISKLFEVYSDRTYNKNMVLMPANYRFEDYWERKVKDYIGGMMDNYAIQQYEKYFGELNKTGIYKL